MNNGQLSQVLRKDTNPKEDKGVSAVGQVGYDRLYIDHPALLIALIQIFPSHIRILFTST